MDQSQKLLEKIDRKMEDISIRMEKAKLAEYVELMNDWKRLLWNNFIAGLVRGMGMAIGFTLLGAIIIYILRYLVLLNLPIIGNFISELVRIVQNNL